MILKNLYCNKKNYIKIAFILNFNFSNWHGGFNVITNLIEGISKKKNYKIVYITKELLSNNEKKILKNKTVIKTNLFNKNRISFYYNILLITLFGKSYNFDNFFQKHNINIISHTSYSGTNSIAKSIFWIPDFQHLEIKKNFSFFYRLVREINFRFAIKNSNIILFSSKAMLASFKKYYNFYTIKYLVNKFSFPTNYKITPKVVKAVKKKYGIGDKYFYIGNQYWEHKNFELIINSLKYLRDKLGNTRIQIISSGSPVGKNDCTYFKKIMNLVKYNNFKNNFIYIGIVSRNEVDVLIAGSLAVINPSVYEGWNATVEQAKSLNKKTILSNIQVHREQKDRNTYLINSNDNVSLSKILDNLEKKRSHYLELNNIFLKKNKILFNNYISSYLAALNNLLKYND
jgi:hypothetical protein